MNSLTIDCQIAAGDWEPLNQCEAIAQTAIGAVIDILDFPLPDDSDVSIVFSNDAAVRELNAHWREQDKPTNVLSFANNDGVDRKEWLPLLGDIVLARETVSREADDQNKSAKDHLTHLIMHGFLHLLGFDHLTDEEADIMEALEVRALAKLGIADPYAAQ